MSKQIKQLIIIVVVLAVCIGGYVGINSYYNQKEKKETAKENANKVTAFEMKDYTAVTGISYAYDKQTIALVKNSDGNWYAQGSEAKALDKDKVETDMLLKIEKIEAEQKIKAPDDISQYGFEKGDNGSIKPATNTIVTMDKDNNANTIYIGNQNPYDSGQYYMMVDGDENVYVIGSDVVNAFEKSVNDLEKEETTEAATEKTTEKTTK